MPVTLEHPNFVETGPILRQGFELNVGINVIPEFLALTAALRSIRPAFIAEIVRAGYPGRQPRSDGSGACPRSAQRSDPSSGGHSAGDARDHSAAHQPVPEPDQELVPGGGDRLPDLVSVGGTVLNQTGQAIEIIAIWMAVYLSLSLITSAFMNWYNQRMALVER
jgi:general L-amino acid transport system permease protein